MIYSDSAEAGRGTLPKAQHDGFSLNPCGTGLPRVVTGRDGEVRSQARPRQEVRNSLQGPPGNNGAQKTKVKKSGGGTERGSV